MPSKDLSGGSLFEHFEMNVMDGVNYVLFKNPISSSIIGSMKNLPNMGIFKGSSTSSTVAKLPPALENLHVSRLVYSGSIFVRLAGISGATAVVLGAYGAHTFYVKDGYEEQKRIYQTANSYHFINSLALLGSPLCRYPKAAGSLIALGMLLFCGTCYYDAFTGRTEFRKFTPIGGTCLIIGWLCFLL